MIEQLVCGSVIPQCSIRLPFCSNIGDIFLVFYRDAIVQKGAIRTVLETRNGCTNDRIAERT